MARIESGKEQFKEVTLVLESQLEVDILTSLLGCTQGDSKGYNIAVALYLLLGPMASEYEDRVLESDLGIHI